MCNYKTLRDQEIKPEESQKLIINTQKKDIEISFEIGGVKYQIPFYNWREKGKFHKDKPTEIHFKNRKSSKNRIIDPYHYKRLDIGELDKEISALSSEIRSQTDQIKKEILEKKKEDLKRKRTNLNSLRNYESKYSRDCNQDNIKTIVIHETAHSLAPVKLGVASKGITAHFNIVRSGAVAQFHDLMEVVSHGSGLNSTSIGIEFAHQSFEKEGRKPNLPDLKPGLTQEEKGLELKVPSRVLGVKGKKIYIPPLHLVEIDAQLVKKIISYIPSIPNKFPQVIEFVIRDKKNNEIGRGLDWLLIYSNYNKKSGLPNPEYFNDWERDETGNKLANPKKCRTGSDLSHGILSHGSYHKDKLCGWFNILYCWIRLRYYDWEDTVTLLGNIDGRHGKEAEEAYETAQTICKVQPYYLRPYKGQSYDIKYTILPVCRRYEYKNKAGKIYYIKVIFRQKKALVSIWEKSMNIKYLWIDRVDKNREKNQSKIVNEDLDEKIKNASTRTKKKELKVQVDYRVDLDKTHRNIFKWKSEHLNTTYNAIYDLAVDIIENEKVLEKLSSQKPDWSEL